MQKIPDMAIKAHGFAFTAASIIYLWAIYFGAMWVLLLTLIPLVQFFPALRECDWLIAAPPVLIVVILLLHVLSGFYTVILEPHVVTLQWFGIPFRRIPTSRFKIFCAVGNGREDVLCLSGYSVDEMANMQEVRLLSSVLNKHNVPLRKRKTDWKNAFAREYLNHLRKRPFSLFTEQNVVMINMHVSLQYSIRQMYPHLPYRNYTGVTSQHASRSMYIADHRAVCLTMRLDENEVYMEPDGIHILTRKKEKVSFIPAQQIKTAVRVDIFRGYEKFYPHHMPLLYISGMSEEELASCYFGGGDGGFYLNLPADQALMTITAATFLAARWNRRETDSCVIFHTENNLEALRTLYPHVQIIETSAMWLDDVEGTLS